MDCLWIISGSLRAFTLATPVDCLWISYVDIYADIVCGLPGWIPSEHCAGGHCLGRLAFRSVRPELPGSALCAVLRLEFVFYGESDPHDVMGPGLIMLFARILFFPGEVMEVRLHLTVSDIELGFKIVP